MTKKRKTNKAVVLKDSCRYATNLAVLGKNLVSCKLFKMVVNKVVLSKVFVLCNCYAAPGFPELLMTVISRLEKGTTVVQRSISSGNVNTQSSSDITWWQPLHATFSIGTQIERKKNRFYFFKTITTACSNFNRNENNPRYTPPESRYSLQH